MTLRLKVKVTKTIAFVALPIYTHIPNLKVLTKIFFKLLRPKGNLCGGVTVLNPKYPRLSSGDTTNYSKCNSFQVTTDVLNSDNLKVDIARLCHEATGLQFHYVIADP